MDRVLDSYNCFQDVSASRTLLSSLSSSFRMPWEKGGEKGKEKGGSCLVLFWATMVVQRTLLSRSRRNGRRRKKIDRRSSRISFRHLLVGAST